MQKILTLLVVVAIASIGLAGCKIWVDPEGNYQVEIEDKDVSEPIDPWVPDKAVENCGISNCHGPVVCGEAVDVCTLEYRLGDMCREFASCEQNATGCELQKTSKYDVCISCIDTCLEIADPQDAFACETKCRSKIQ